MPITLITGTPGDGKTLLAMSMMRDAYKAGGRPIYCHGVSGNLPSMVNALDDPREWEKCPDGSLIFIDEAWKSFGHLQDGSRAPTPPHVLALATHRHRGFDFVMTTQMVNQLFPFMRGLIGEHIHVSRKFGTSMTTLYRWGEVCEDVKSATQREKSVSETWIHPSDLFPEYSTGSGIHTIKRKIPWKVMLIPASVIGAALALWFGYVLLMGVGGKSEKEIAALQADSGEAGTAADSEPASLSGKKKGEPLTDKEWIARLTPRWEGVHGSEPIFDDRKVTAQPRTFCVMSGTEPEQTCQCYTEQITRITRIFAACKAAALHRSYDYFVADVQQGAPAQYVPKPGDAPSTLGNNAAGGSPLQIGSPNMGKIQ